MQVLLEVTYFWQSVVSNMENVQLTTGGTIPPLAIMAGADFDLEILKKISPCFIGLAKTNDVS